MKSRARDIAEEIIKFIGDSHISCLEIDSENCDVLNFIENIVTEYGQERSKVALKDAVDIANKYIPPSPNKIELKGIVPRLISDEILSLIKKNGR